MFVCTNAAFKRKQLWRENLITTTAVRVKLHSLSNWMRQGVRTRDLIASCGFIDPTLARSSVLYPAAVILLSNPQAQL
jgi:hypothetical protein